MARDTELIPGATPTLRRRLYAKIARPSPRGCCRYWRGGHLRTRDGRRPAIRVGGRGTGITLVARILLVLRDRVSLVERRAYRLEAGHTCGNHWCVNVAHLRWQTRSQNEIEKNERRRAA